MLRKSFVLVLALVVLVSTSVFVAAAQTGAADPTPFSPGWMHHSGETGFGHGMMSGHGMMDHGFGGMMGNVDHDGFAIVAEALGLEPAALVEALQSGQTLAEIADAQGVELQTIYAAMLAGAEAHMTQLVEAGDLTQEQADEHLAYVRDHIAEMPMFSGEGCQMMNMPAMSGMMGGRGMMGHGMMGRNG